MMKIKYIILLISVVILLKLCTYNSITHLDDKELQWMKSYTEENETLYFCSKSDTDTMIVKEIEIFNSLNPFIQNEGVSEYKACGDISYEIKHNGSFISGSFSILKEDNNKPVLLSLILCDRYALNIKYNLVSHRCHNYIYRDCIIVDDNNSEIGQYQSNNCGINRFVWSKSKGLLNYSFEDGQIYELIE